MPAAVRSAAPEPAEGSGAFSDARSQHQRKSYEMQPNMKAPAGSVVTSRGTGALVPWPAEPRAYPGP